MILRKLHRHRIRSELPNPQPKAAHSSVHWRKTTNYRQWRSLVVARDNHACQFCGSKKDLTAHHIIPANVAPDLRYHEHNGITLCRICHRLLDRHLTRRGEGVLPPCERCVFVQLLTVLSGARYDGTKSTLKRLQQSADAPSD